MVAVSGPDPARPQVLCIGLPQGAVEQISRILEDGVVLTKAADAHAAISTLTSMASQQITMSAAAPIDVGAVTSRVLLDHGGRRALAEGRDLRLSPREFDLLTLLHDHPGHAWSYEELSDRVWHQPYLGDPDTIATAVRRLRKRLGPASSVEITALRGFGYRLDILDDAAEIAS